MAVAFSLLASLSPCARRLVPGRARPDAAPSSSQPRYSLHASSLPSRSPISQPSRFFFIFLCVAELGSRPVFSACPWKPRPSHVSCARSASCAQLRAPLYCSVPAAARVELSCARLARSSSVRPAASLPQLAAPSRCSSPCALSSPMELPSFSARRSNSLRRARVAFCYSCAYAVKSLRAAARFIHPARVRSLGRVLLGSLTLGRRAPVCAHAQVPARVQFTASSERFSSPSRRFVALLCRAPNC
jgi:hypothetical protein